MEIQQMLLTPNEYSRPQIKLEKVKKIVIHWVGNASSKGISNRSYFESLKDKKIYASAHYIIGLEGEIIQCVTENEIAYHAKQANSYSIGIENCHPDWEGKFNDKTYASLIELCADICKRYNLNPLEDILRHFDITQKNCPQWYIKHEDDFTQLKQDVYDQLVGKDEQLVTAVSELNKSGIINTVEAWNNEDNMNLDYVPSLIKNMALSMMTHEEYVSVLKSKDILSDEKIWLDKAYTSNHVRSLLIKMVTKK